MKTATGKYAGRIVSVPGQDGFAFIGIESVSKHDGSPHDLTTTADIFLHRDDCGSALMVGKTLSFDVKPDTERKGDTLRAFGAVELIEADLLPPGPPMEGFTATMTVFAPANTGSSLIVSPSPAQVGKMKQIDPAEVEKVLRNKPVKGVARDSTVPPNVDEMMQVFLRHLFPSMEQFGATFNVNVEGDELEAAMVAAREDHASLGMTIQLEQLETEVERFRKFQKGMRFMLAEKLVRPDTIIPMEYLPDFFTAVPVWYHFVDEQSKSRGWWDSTEQEMRVNDVTAWFCQQVPTQEWADIFQMFDYRPRTLST